MQSEIKALGEVVAKTDGSSSEKFVKPKLPEAFTQKGGIGMFGLIAYMLAMFILPAMVNYHIYFELSWPLTLKILASIPFFIVGGQAFHLMGWIGHEGFHFTLSDNRYVSVFIGLFFSSMTVLFFQVGMAMDHWSHHRFANTDKDPDLKLLGHFQNFLSRMLFQRNRANRHYFLRTLNLALGRPLAEELKNIRLPFSLETFQKLAWANFACVIGWVTFYLFLESLVPGLIWVMVVIPMLFGAALSGLRSFTEHADTEAGDLKDTRSRTHWFFTAFEFGANYHLEHHLYPSVAQWKLPAVSQWLKQNGYYQHLDDGLLDDSLSVYLYATSAHRYGKKTQPLVDALPA